MESRTSRSWAAQSSRKPRREAIFSNSKSFSDRLGHGLWPGDLRTCVTVSTVAICLLTGFIPALSRSCHKYISSCIKEVFNNRLPWAAVFSLWAPSVALAFHHGAPGETPRVRISRRRREIFPWLPALRVESPLCTFRSRRGESNRAQLTTSTASIPIRSNILPSVESRPRVVLS